MRRQSEEEAEGRRWRSWKQKDRGEGSGRADDR